MPTASRSTAIILRPRPKGLDFMSDMSAPRVVVLGSGTSTGVPIIGCQCPVCTSTDPHDDRLRSAVNVSYGGFSLQIDVPPDFRQQVFRYGLSRVDAVLITHAHADHILGIDDIRQFNALQHASIPAYGRDFTLAGIGRMFSYICQPRSDQRLLYRPKIDFYELTDDPIQIGPFSVTSRRIPHGPEFSTAFSLTFEGRRFVYAPDCSAVTPELVTLMESADVVVIDGLRDRPHPSHLNIASAVEAIQQCRISRAYLTHIGHDVLHADLERRLPAEIRPAFDGLEFTW